MELFDTHCHIHEALRPSKAGTATQRLWARVGNPNPGDILARAREAGVARMMCIGTASEDSKLAVQFVQKRESCWASIGIHPHEAKVHVGDAQALAMFRQLARKPKVVAVGECGLDYYYEHSPKKAQEEILRFQLDLALQHDLPLVFHVRDAFDDFWPIFDDYKGLCGVVHSFSATRTELEQALARGLYIGLNGIMTFTKSDEQLAAAKAVPLDNLLLETDAPFLTPAPHRGTICEPRHVRDTAAFLADLRGESLDTVAHATTKNARKLFNI